MTATTPQAAAAAPARWTTRPWIGVFGVLFGSMIASFAGRLLSLCLPDLKAGLGLSVDEAAWIGTVFNCALMAVGPFSVYLGAILGARRVLLACSVAFTGLSLMLPLVGHGPLFFVLLALSGLTAGTFYPLTLSFILRNLPPKFILLGIAMYAMDIVFTTYVATSVAAWYLDHLSWRWAFWNSALFTPIMFVLVLFGIPWQPIPTHEPDDPRPSWRGFLYVSIGFAFLYGALDQGERLDWLGSGVIVGLLCASGFLFVCALVRRFVFPNALLNLRFLAQWNIVLLGLGLVLFRLVMLSAVVVIPNFLGTAQGYKPLQTGHFFWWLALPQAVFGLFAMWLIKRVDPRIIFGLGFLVVGIACLRNTSVTSAWSGATFVPSLLLLACGFAFAFNGMVAVIVLQAINVGALDHPVEALTYSGCFQTMRLLGGEAGTAWVLHMLAAREQFHSNVLVGHASAGNVLGLRRFASLRGGMSVHADASSAAARAAVLFGLQVRGQAFTLAVADLFRLIAWASFLALVVIALLRSVRVQYRDVLSREPQP